MERVLAVDPGVTTGWAFWNGLCVKETGEDDQRTFCWRAWHLAMEWSDKLTIVCERYTITAETIRKSRQSASLEIIGTLRFISGSAPFVLQSAADAKRFSTDEKLEKLQWRRPAREVHANDALRHLCLYLAKSGHEGVISGIS